MKRTTLAMIAGLFAMATAAIAQPVFYWHTCSRPGVCRFDIRHD